MLQHHLHDRPARPGRPLRPEARLRDPGRGVRVFFWLLSARRSRSSSSAWSSTSCCGSSRRRRRRTCATSSAATGADTRIAAAEHDRRAGPLHGRRRSVLYSDAAVRRLRSASESGAQPPTIVLSRADDRMTGGSGRGSSGSDPGGVGRRVDPDVGVRQCFTRTGNADAPSVRASDRSPHRCRRPEGSMARARAQRSLGREPHGSPSCRPEVPGPRIPSIHRRALVSHAATSPADDRRARDPDHTIAQRWSSASATAQPSSGIMSSWCPVIWKPSPPASTGRRTTFSLGR
jgi:hypothetical protein